MMTTQHIGAAGELLVQYQFLKHDIDSARLTTDSGVDLVVYAPLTALATTVQVKTILASSPAGGRGAISNGWWFPHTCRADMLALVRRPTACGSSPLTRHGNWPSSTTTRATASSIGARMRRRLPSAPAEKQTSPATPSIAASPSSSSEHRRELPSFASGYRGNVRAPCEG